ncbi:undecaprenyl-phosphate glucose phosphotransferase [Anaerolineae bacterium CFX7]|nr:undecaprenyl-phosphate glucose phosphotransferase [Anaerolineae bacterium CFX7]
MQKYARVLMFIQIGIDFILINAAFAFAYFIRYELRFPITVAEANYVAYTEYIPITLGLSVGLLVIYHIEGIYNYVRGRTWLEEFYSLLTATFTGIAILVFFFFFFRPQYYSRLIYLYAGILIVLCLTVARVILRGVLGVLRKRGYGVDRAILVGGGEMGRAIMRNVLAQPGLGYQITGFVDDDPHKGAIGNYPLLGGTDQLPRLLREHNIDEVIITLPWHARDKIVRIMEISEAAGARVKIVPDLFQLSLSQIAVDAVGGIPLIGVKDASFSSGAFALKRAMDVLFAGILFLLMLLPMALIALAIKLTSPGPIIFAQRRVGRGGKLFTAYKFRTMRVGADDAKQALLHLNEATGPLFKIRNDPRITNIGKFLRRTSLDELPQFWNVLNGDMSLVGPRPPLPNEVAQYEDWHKRRLDVSPGVTGLWQVSGRSELTFDEMVMLDLYYIENWSPWLDIWIMLKTIPALLTARGAY